MQETKLFATRLPKELIKHYKVKAALQETSVQDLVFKVLNEWIESQEKEGK